MKKSAITCVVGLGLSLGACGGGSNSSGGTTMGTGIEGETGNDSVDAAEGQDSNNTTQGDGDGDPGDGDGDPGDGDGDPGDGDGDADEAGTGPKWDLGTIPDSAFQCGGS